MKSLRNFYIAFLLLMMSNNLYSQGNLSIEIKPNTPIINDEIKLFTNVSFSSAGSYKTHNLSWIDNNNLYVELYYTSGGQQMPTQFIDSMPLGQLPEGLYTIIADLKTGDGSNDFDFYTKNDSDTITFRVEKDLGVNNEDFDDKSIYLFPNPTTHQLNFTLKNNSKPIKLEIYNLTGKRVKRTEYFNHSSEAINASIDVSALNKGVYFCRFIIGNKQVTRRFFKQ